MAAILAGWTRTGSSTLLSASRQRALALLSRAIRLLRPLRGSSSRLSTETRILNVALARLRTILMLLLLLLRKELRHVLRSWTLTLFLVLRLARIIIVLTTTRSRSRPTSCF